MNRDLGIYIKKYSHIVPNTVITGLVEKLENFTQWQRHYFYDPSKNEKYSFDNEPETCFLTSSEQNQIQTQLWHFIYKYIFEDIGKMSWFQGWNGYSQIRFNKYSINEDMKMHCDHIQTLFDGQRRGIPILSIVGLLNNNFTGGDFVMFDNIKINLNAGDIIIFPSNFLYPHKVTAVTAGTRYSFVSWVW